MNRVDNLHAGRGTRAATVIVPAVLLILGTSGVVAKPTFGFEAARRQRAEAAMREHELELERARATRLERQGGSALIETARSTVASLVPTRMSALALQNILVLVAAKHQVELETIEIGSELETTFATLDDRIAVVEAELSGSATLGDFVAFIDGVQALRLAGSVSKTRIARPTPGDARFEFRTTFTFHHRAAPRPLPDEHSASGP